MFSLIPRFSFQSVTDITPDFLKEQGIRFVMLDIDNTITAYNEPSPSAAVFEWFERVRSSGVSLFLVSNSKRAGRVEAIAKSFNVSYILNARKPSPRALRHAMDMAGRKPGESALIGDQIFTDTLAANLSGAVSVIVHPICLQNPVFKLRYYCEIPFRCRKKPHTSLTPDP